MKAGAAIAALIGLLAATALIGYQGFAQVGAAVAGVGWKLLPLSLFHLAPVVFSTLGWRALFDAGIPRPFATLFVLRWVRESINDLMPVAQVGGEIIGARLLALRGSNPALAGASVVADITLKIVSQFVFTVIGVVLFSAGGFSAHILRWALIGLAVSGPVLAAFFLAQRWGLFNLVERLLVRAADQRDWTALGGVAGLHDQLTAIYRSRSRVLLSWIHHMLSWTVGAGEIWLGLYLMGHPISLLDAFIFETIAQAVRGAAFLIPGGLGVQEGGYLLLGGAFGLGPDIALALSLLKRVRELVLGLPGLLYWQVHEGRRFFAGRRVR